MARRFLRKHLPHPDRIRASPILRIFGKLLHQPNLWHLNRRSVSRAMLVGLFWTVFPMPFQMIPGTACAIFLRANIPLTLLLIWLTNPLTFPPVLYACYRLGRVLLGMPPSELDFEMSWDSVVEHLEEIWRPLYAGALAVGMALAAGGFALTLLFWRWNVARRWGARRFDNPGHIG